MISDQLIGSINQSTIVQMKIGNDNMIQRVNDHKDISTLEIFQWIKFLYANKISIATETILEIKFQVTLLVLLFLCDIIRFFVLRSIITLVYYEKYTSLQYFKRAWNSTNLRFQ